MNKKTKVAISITTVLLSSSIFANEYMAIINSNESNLIYKINEGSTNWSDWNKIGVPYDCTEWTPDPKDIDYGFSIEQERSCSVDQERTRDHYLILSDGSHSVVNTEEEYRTVNEIETKNSSGEKDFIEKTIENEWSEWSDSASVSCVEWTPEVSDVNLNIAFTQTRNCGQDQERTKTFTDVWASGKETHNKTETEYQTVNTVESQGNVGTKNFIDTEREDLWSEWVNTDSYYDCDTWTPDVSTIPFGDDFTQTRNCSQDQERIRNVYDVWADGSETFNRTEVESQTITEIESKNAIGTENFTDTERIDSWSSWVNEGSYYDCDIWNPNVSTIPFGDDFTQTRNCSQDQERIRNVYDVWADGSETLNRVEIDTQTITEQENQAAIGTKNFIDATRNDSWSSWNNTGSHYNCLYWNPETSTILYGETFTQTRDCSQEQERTRNVYDVWADGSETLNRVETDTQTITEQESQSAIGTKNFTDTERADSWSSWNNIGNHHSCENWNPLPSTVDYGNSFEQIRDCLQEQERTRNVYDVWADGSETLNRIETDTQTITEQESQNATGTKNFIENESAKSWSNWSDNGNHHSCESWSPLESTVNYGNSFTQYRDCSQNQIRSREIYDVWADGSETLNRVETDTQTITEQESQNATGTKNYKDSTRNGNWSSWIDDGSHYACNTWTPAISTVNLGDNFTQTRDCSQDQERTRTIYDVWADGSETVKNTESDTQTITKTESKGAVGTKNYITGTSYGNWSNWSYESGYYDCTVWTPETSSVNYGASFTQNQDCNRDQERTRTVYNDWADGTKTTKSIEIEEKTVTEKRTQSATGTKNYILSTSTTNGTWSNSGSLYSCSSWTPFASTVNDGVVFEQTRDCKQEQTRTETTYNDWADGSKTVESTKEVTKVIDVEESRNETGTKPFEECRFSFSGGTPNSVITSTMSGTTQWFTFYWDKINKGTNPYPNTSDSLYNYYKGDLKNTAGSYKEYEVCRTPR